MFIRLVMFLAAAMVIPAGASQVFADVVLNEILADPAQDWDGSGSVHSRDDEWVEICNRGTAPVDLSGYRLASADTTWRYEFSGTLEPGGVRVVYGSESYAWEQQTGNPAYGLRLANGGGKLTLWQVTENSQIQVDCYTYADHEAEDDRSTGRFPDGQDVWVLFDALNPFTGQDEPLGTGCSPSPGVVAVCATPVEETTWGALKNRWSAASGEEDR